MDAFESLIETLFRRNGYWTRTSLKVGLTSQDKKAIERPTSPRWEIDVVAYKGSTNEVLAIECKSYLDSSGVVFRNGSLEPARLYKLFTDDTLREVVLNRLCLQLADEGLVAANPTVSLCLATGKIASRTDREAMREHMVSRGWHLFDEQWILDQLGEVANAAYEDDVAHVVAKLITRNKTGQPGQ